MCVEGEVINIFKDTLWLFIVASKYYEEGRHVDDVAYCLSCLENNQIVSNDIILFMQGEHKERFKKLCKDKYKIKNYKNLSSVIRNNSHKNIVVFVIGHGNVEFGIDTPDYMKPYKLIEILRSNKKTENIVLYLAQCYAGIFNYISVTEKPELTIVAATNLYQSVSSSNTINNNTWVANLFLIYLFEWINYPIDVDGDGIATVMDSYKYAGAKTNLFCQERKGEYIKQTIELINEKEELYAKLESTKDEKRKATFELQIEENDELLKRLQPLHYNHQEPWIYNTELALKLKFK